jgi:LPXTG-site transpeptidase (sortase) family protein
MMKHGERLMADHSVGKLHPTGNLRSTGADLPGQVQTGVGSRGTGKRLLKAGQYVFLLLALVCLGSVALNYVRARLFQSYQSWRLDRALTRHTQPPSRAHRTSLPVVCSVPAGALIGRIAIPRIGISVIVLEGDGDDILGKAAGHVPTTAFPGGAGNVVIAGHRDTFFRALRNIRKDDEITLTTTAGTYQYQVEYLVKVRPEDVQVLKASDHPTLTLITCYPFNYIGPAPMRFVVEAAEIGSPQGSGGQLLASTLPFQDLHSAAGAFPSAGSEKHCFFASLSSHNVDSTLTTATSDAGTLIDRRSKSDSDKGKLNSAKSVEFPETKSPKSAYDVAESHPLRAKKIQLTGPSASTREMAESEQDDAPVESSAHSHKKLGKVRAWLGAIPRHFRKDHADDNAAESK